MALHTWFAFFVACWLICLSPGAGAVASMSTGLRYGVLRGGWNILGLELGLVLQIAIVAAGVGALLATSALAFALIKWFGVAYLLYLAVRQWRAPTQDYDTLGDDHQGRRRGVLLIRGFLINASNPKAVVFLLAVLPQFLDPSRPMALQYALMGLTLITVDVVVMAGYTGLAARALKLLRSARQQRLVNRGFAALFAAAASLLATARRAAV
ncbi:Putative ABC transport system, membrane protein [Alloalcanivorax dieselolei B5]|uniref:Putative ABC transport system, membrane protein n=1 Tax=Alcanivorax dieselolei (strain DSM 16502 / CGMCC 1.3690 / MCCC 1A00001 / B-5) TaxID=930169 RepID=K0CF61_ALCDB|nr:LysE family transporter [Alloalcanivorax dieselolei]AFT70302.1 Putative ABC transport system, membrane protein [Alloalcanivorax dieselolei B5]GGK09862.1 hypothetical protein GCM10007426_42630 [Alloalcanivorax dieselolei]